MSPFSRVSLTLAAVLLAQTAVAQTPAATPQTPQSAPASASAVNNEPARTQTETVRQPVSASARPDGYEIEEFAQLGYGLPQQQAPAHQPAPARADRGVENVQFAFGDQ